MSKGSVGIRRRWLTLTVASFIGAVSFLPFASAGSGQSVLSLWPFAAIATTLAAAASWPGLRFWDSVDLPMPILRGLEQGQVVWPAKRATFTALGVGVVGGIAGLAALTVLDAPEMPGSLLARLASAGFAGVTLEVILHLFGMGLLVRWSGKVWIGIVGAAVLFAGFHLAGAQDLGATLLITSVLANGGLALLFGWMGAAYGFEYLVIAHIVAHMITVGAG